MRKLCTLEWIENGLEKQRAVQVCSGMSRMLSKSVYQKDVRLVQKEESLFFIPQPGTDQAISSGKNNQEYSNSGLDNQKIALCSESYTEWIEMSLICRPIRRATTVGQVSYTAQEDCMEDSGVRQ